MLKYAIVKYKNEKNKHFVSDAQQEASSPRTRKASQTYYGSEKQVIRDGIKIKEIEVTGEKPQEPVDMKKQKKLQRKKSIDKEELNVSCRDLGKADHEGWLFKKAGGHGIVPVSWKKFWVVVKLGKLYCYKTSFNISADYLINLNDYTVDNTTEKKKSFAFHLKPNEEDKKQAVFAGETEEEVNGWVDIIKKILSGENVTSGEDKKVPDYEQRKSFTMAGKLREKINGEAPRKRPSSSAFMSAENETTGMPAGFGARTSSTSQPRVRKISGNTNPSSVLSVGSMFTPLEEKQDDGGKEDVSINILYKEITVETQVAAEEVHMPGEPVKQPEEESEKEIVINGGVKRFVAQQQSDPEPIEKKPESPVQKTPEPAPVVAPAVSSEKTVISEDVVQLSVQEERSDRKTASQLFQDLPTEEDAESVIKQLEKPEEEEKPTPAPVALPEPVSDPTPEVEAVEEEKTEVKRVEIPVEEEIVSPTVKVDEPVAIDEPEPEESTVKQPEVSSSEALELNLTNENRESIASDDSDSKPTLDLSPTVAETNVDLGEDLDIPTLDSSDSLIDDITMELSTTKDQSNVLSPQSNGTVIAAI